MARLKPALTLRASPVEFFPQPVKPDTVFDGVFGMSELIP
jgi:hypothetical protein